MFNSSTLLKSKRYTALPAPPLDTSESDELKSKSKSRPDSEVVELSSLEIFASGAHGSMLEPGSIHFCAGKGFRDYIPC